jgi:hypothetical protein
MFWGAADVAWEAQLARLAAYMKAEHGDCNVPRGWAEDPRLAKWVSLQREYKRKLDRGEPSHGMTAERAGRLAALGCVWGLSEQEQEQERTRVMGPDARTRGAVAHCAVGPDAITDAIRAEVYRRSVSPQKREMRLEKRPRGTASATAGAGAKHGARSVRALEVYGGDDTDSDGDEAPRAEEEATAAGEAAADPAVREVKAEPAPALEPAIKPEPSDSRQQQQPTCVRSAKRRAIWVRGGAGGGPRARVQAEEAAS